MVYVFGRLVMMWPGDWVAACIIYRTETAFDGYYIAS